MNQVTSLMPASQFKNIPSYCMLTCKVQIKHGNMNVQFHFILLESISLTFIAMTKWNKF